MRRAAPAFFLFLLLSLSPLGLFAAEKGKPPADAPPVRLSADGAKPKWKNVEQLRKFVEKGDPQACFELAERFLYGDEVPKDIKQAVSLLEQAAHGGIANAWFRLGKIYHDGLLGAPDYERTLDYYTRAARAGVPEAQHNIGAMLVSARGVKRDLVEGLAWLVVATKTGAVSTAEMKVRDQLAKRPADLKAAETRASAIWGNLSTATTHAVLKSAPAVTSNAESRLHPPTPAITNPLAKPAIEAPAMVPLARPEISPPAAPTIPLPPGKK